MKLVKYDSNWADEMAIDGFRVFTDNSGKNTKKISRSISRKMKGIPIM
jgi:hypothetical protein